MAQYLTLDYGLAAIGGLILLYLIGKGLVAYYKKCLTLVDDLFRTHW